MAKPGFAGEVVLGALRQVLGLTAVEWWNELRYEVVEVLCEPFSVAAGWP